MSHSLLQSYEENSTRFALFDLTDKYKFKEVVDGCVNETVHQLFVDFKKAYDSVRREELYNILREFAVPMKLVRLIKMCLNETYNKVR
jgi:hypothetical protein